MATTTDTLIFEFKTKDNASKVFDAWEKRLKDLEKQVEKSFGKIEDTMAGAFKDVSVDFDISKKIVGGLKGIGGSLKTYLVNPFLGAFDTIVGMAGTAFKAIGGMTVDIFKGAVSDSIALEDAMAGVRKTAGLTADEVLILQREVRDFAVEELKGAASAVDLAKALEIAGQQGVMANKTFEQGSQDALAFAKTMVMAGEALGGLTVESAAEQLGLFHGVFSDFIPDIERAASVLNFFGDTTKRSEGHILNLAKGLSGASQMAGMTEQATLALAGTLGGIPLQASTVSTAMSRILLKMQTDTSKFAAVLKMDAQEFTNLVNTDMTAALSMMSQRLSEMNKQDFSKALADLSLTGKGVSAVMAGLGRETLTFNQALTDANTEWDKNTSLMNSFISNADRTSQLWGALKEIMSNTIGLMSDAMLPVMKDLLKDVNLLAMQFRQWFVETEFVEKKLTPALEQAKLFLQELVKSSVEFVKNADWSEIFSSVEESIKNAWESTKGWVESLKSFGESFDPMTLASGFQTVIDIGGKVLTFVGNLGSTLRELSPLVELFKVAWNGVSVAINAVKAITQPFFDGLVEMVYAFQKAMSGDIFGGLKDGILAINTTLDGMFTMMKKAGLDAVDALAGAVLGKLMGAFDKLSGKVKGIWDGLKNAIKGTEKAADDAAKSIDKVNDSQKEVAKEGYEQSVWPDLKSWIGKNVEETKNLANGLTAVTSDMVGIESAAVSALQSITAATRAQQLAVKSAGLAPITPVTPATPVTPGTPATPSTPVQRKPIGGTSGAIPGSGNGQTRQQLIQQYNQFIGNNVMDESSKSRFAREIGMQQQDLAAAIITA